MRIDEPSEWEPATDGTFTQYGAHFAHSRPATTSAPNPTATAHAGGPARRAPIAPSVTIADRHTPTAPPPGRM
ncbi:hypothetical protein Acsp06_56080 [Actinomycetospora sp. NBRC 106375]|nr:hypothetical protein Acsp06_56080 [Actinomycetospora sp. NBRC 106375]